MHSDPVLILIGVVVGLLVGLTGVGGGSLMTPILVLMMGVPAAVAVGTDLVYGAVTRTVGAITHLRQETVRIEAVRWLATGSVPSAVVTTLLVDYGLHHAAKATTGVITHALAAVLLFVALSLMLRPLIAGHVKEIRVHRKSFSVGIGVLVGALVALTSVGGGALTMVALLVLYPTAATNELVGTDVVQAAILSIVAAGAHIFIATVNFHMAGLLLIGSLPGVVVGSRLSLRIPDLYLRLGLAGTMALIGIRLL